MLALSADVGNGRNSISLHPTPFPIFYATEKASHTARNSVPADQFFFAFSWLDSARSCVRMNESDHAMICVKLLDSTQMPGGATGLVRKKSRGVRL